MAFQLKDFASITGSMINWMRSVQKIVTDFNPGAVMRSMLEACATEIDELYKQIFIGLKEAIPVSVYTSFSFPPLAATPAGGQLTLTFTAQGADEVIAAGTLWIPNNGNGINYTQTANVTLLAGHTSVNVPVSAVTAGSAGNLPQTTGFNPNPVPTGFVSATNTIAFINGTDTETPDEQKIRFNAFISTLSRGTVAAIRYGCTTTVLLDAGGNVTERVAKLLLEQYTSSGAGLQNHHLTQQEMAALAGTAREVVGRALKELEMAGAIEMRQGRAVVLNEERLRLLAAGA